MKKILFFASAVAVLFSSCSTDNTQDVIGNEAMGTISATAAYQQDATRTQLDKDGNVVWSKGDAIGVFGASGPQVQFGLVSGENTTGGKFSGNKNYLKVGEPAYAYYPYTKGTELTGTEVELEILAEQTYLPTDGYASFDAAMAPAYAYIEKLSDTDNVAFNFKGAAAYLEFPVVGYGTLESMTLTIGDGTLTPLAGVGSIDITAVDNPATENVDETPYIELASTDATEITVYCGDVALKPYDPVMVSFVVPANIDLTKVNLKATVSGVDIPAKSRTFTPTGGEYPKTKINQRTKINFDSKKNPWTFGLEGKYAIDAVAAYGLEGKERAILDFITYAFFTQPGDASDLGKVGYPSVKDYETLAQTLTGDVNITINGAFDSHEYAVLFDEAKGVAKYDALILAEELDFAAFDAKAVFAKLGAYTTESSLYNLITVYKNALTWYIENDNAIESLKYNAILGHNPEQPAVIKSLNVIGNGITVGAALKDLKITNSLVNAVDVTSSPVGFVAGKNDANIDVENLVLGADNFVAAPAANVFVGGIFGQTDVAETDNKEVVVDVLPVVNVTNIMVESMTQPKVGQIYGYVYTSTNGVISLADNKVTSLDVPAIHTTSANNTVLDFTSNIAAPEGVKYAGVIAVNDHAALTSIVVDGTSYYNGTPAATVGGDAYFTAEELAYALNTLAVDNIVLTHNIDMQSTEIINGVDHKAANINTISTTMAEDGTYNVFEIKNVKAAIYNASEVAALFGNANVSNIKLTNVAIDVPASAKKAAGVAVAGTVTNVTIDGLTINIPAASKLTVVGGVLAEANVNDIDNVNVKGLAITNAGANVLKIRAGIMAGTLKISPNSYANLKPFYTEAATFTKVGEEQPKCSTGQLEYYTATNNYGAALPFGTISVDNSSFFTGGNVKAYLNVAEGKFGTMTRLAAGIVFAKKLTDNTEKVEYDETKIEEYNYVLISNAPIAKQRKVFGFMQE